jgi:hypothetical protein
MLEKAPNRAGDFADNTELRPKRRSKCADRIGLVVKTCSVSKAPAIESKSLDLLPLSALLRDLQKKHEALALDIPFMDKVNLPS